MASRRADEAVAGAPERMLKPGERLLTPDDVCEMLAVNKRWPYDQVQRQAIPHIRMGQRLRFRSLGLNRWLAASYEPGRR